MSTRFETRDLMNFLVDHAAPDLPAAALGAILDRLVWCLDDNGNELLRIREEWLRGDDRKRVEIALSMEEVLPFDEHDRDLMLHELARRWPHLRPRCEVLLALSSPA